MVKQGIGDRQHLDGILEGSRKVHCVDLGAKASHVHPVSRVCSTVQSITCAAHVPHGSGMSHDSNLNPYLESIQEAEHVFLHESIYIVLHVFRDPLLLWVELVKGDFVRGHSEDALHHSYLIPCYFPLDLVVSLQAPRRQEINCSCSVPFYLLVVEKLVCSVIGS